MELPNTPTKTFHKATYPTLDPTRPELSAKGKSVIITGGGTGIGAETAKYFAKAGAALIALLGRREEPLLSTKASLDKDFPSTKILAIATDITKSEQAKAAVDQVVAITGKVDVLVSNAAVVGILSPIADATPDALLDGIFTNLKMSANITSAFLPHAAKDGVVIDTNSSAAHMDVAPGFASYNIAKLAIARYFSCLQFENPNLSVFCVQPGAIKSDMSREAGYQEAKEGEEFIWNFPGAHLISKHDDPNLPASFNVWLASPEARFLKGKFVWSGWDVDELMAMREKIERTAWLSVGLQGWPFL
ncbi:hypothetical protein DE146DRAFT_402422 [Phaeosphaeria sp. MPI-PUGE-AT-0046c]|nr:hypothetical protein DE146DRAFT_402422 [Phaeosphaeria sp. MPI-PUGE-AT-0046c]